MGFFFSHGNFPFLQGGCIFDDLRFRNSHFLAACFSSEYLVFRSETSIEQPLLENRKFFRAVTFWNNFFFDGGIVKIKHVCSELLFRSRYFWPCISFFRRATFSKQLIFQKRIIPYNCFFLNKLLFQSLYFLTLYFAMS